MSSSRYIPAIIAIFLSLCILAPAQGKRERERNRKEKETSGFVVPIWKDTTRQVITDSMRAVLDSIHRADSVFRADSSSLMESSSLKAPAFSGAKDSIVEDFRDGKQFVHYYGDVSVEYTGIKITADYIRYDIKEQSVYARGTLDTLTGEFKGNPVMTEGNQTYDMEEVTYNFATKKAHIRNVVTKDDQGILHGKTIKMMPDQSVNIIKGKYTLCDCEEPHYYLHLSAAKIMTKPSQNTVFGPAWPVVEGVPMFPIVLPFGFIPKRPERATGILFPTFGEEASRGFYFRDLGMYFVIGDYFDVALTSNYYTLGSWALDFNSRYKVNYKFNGNLSITYSNDKLGEKGEPDYSESTNFAFKWSHQQDSKAHPGSTFSASVNFSSPNNSRFNSRNITEALNNQISSSVSWSRNWNGKYNLSINGTHSQNSRDSSYAITLPNLTFSISKFYPFKRKVRVGKERWYEKFSLAYNTTFQNKINFKATDVGKPGFWDKMQNGMQHSFSIGLPNFALFKYININPNISYGMNWMFNSKTKYYNPETDRVEETHGGSFSTFGVAQTVSGSISMDTQLYGLFNFGKHRKIQAIRHIFKPSLSMSFAPEMGTYANGWRTLNYTDAKGNVRSQDYNIYEGQIYSAPGKGKSATARIVLGNNLEMKVRDLRDTTGKGSKKIKLLDQFNINTGYNFLADSCRMNDVGITVSTNIFGKLGLSGNLNFDPYAVDAKGQKCAKFQIAQDGRLLRLKNASLSMSYSFSGKGAINGNDGTKEGGNAAGAGMPSYQRIYYHPITGEYIPGGWVYYTNPDSPWSINLSYALSYARSYSYDNARQQLNTKNNFTQTLSLSGNIKITNALSINATTGFDLQSFKITTSQISATYDLHCFNISFSWVPSGTWKSWNFQINANAAALADLLKFKKSNSYTDNASFWQ